MRNTRLYPIWPAAPVTATRTGAFEAMPGRYSVGPRDQKAKPPAPELVSKAKPNPSPGNVASLYGIRLDDHLHVHRRGSRPRHVLVPSDHPGIRLGGRCEGRDP